MKIAQIAPLIESVPPRFYGGTERVVSYLTEELVRLGHDVTLFASGDSNVGAPCQLRDDGAAARPERARSDSLLHVDAGPGTRMCRRFRHSPFPH
jgi:glycosyltransferase involved in cell wall biosynthesis